MVAVDWTAEADLSDARAADVVFLPAAGGLVGTVETLRGDGRGAGPKIIADLYVRPEGGKATGLVAAAKTYAAEGAHGIRLILPEPHRQIVHITDTLMPALRTAGLPVCIAQK